MAEEVTQEFWRWTESNWKNPDIDWRDAQIVTVGIDVGSVSSQSVIVTDGKIFAYGNMRTGSDSPNSARNALTFALEATDMSEDRMDYCIGTGYGRVNVPFADRTVTEIACHARGANFIYGSEVRTVLDVGGQDIKAIQCDEKGKVTNFLMNDKCAAGTGRFLEVMAKALEVDIDNFGQFSNKADQPSKISSLCTVFAESEVISLISMGEKRENIIAGIHESIAARVEAMANRTGLKAPIMMTGGVAKNIGVVQALEKKLGQLIEVSPHSQLTGAIGAALLAQRA